MPRFFITVGSPVSAKMKFYYKGQLYSQRFTQQFNFPSLHIVGSKDQFIESGQTADKLFTTESKPKLIVHDEGHKFPRAIKDDDFAVLKKFILDEYTHKFGSDKEFKCDYEKYDFNNPQV